jgi:uncharacterized protein (DUF983 family)
MSNDTEGARENDKAGFALLRGLRGRCPACGKGKLFRAFVKVADSCSVCGEPFHHHRADDFPAYLTIVLVGHLVVPLTMYVEIAYAPSYWVHVAIWLPTVLVLSLGALQPIKGLIVAMQWYMGMHGFAEAKLARESGLAPGVEQVDDRRALQAGAQAGLEQHTRLERMQTTAPDQAGLAQRDLRARAAIGVA